MTTDYKFGPWVAEHGSVIDERGEIVATLVGGAVRRNDDNEDRAASRLIAAAPDMQSALEMALEYREDRQRRYKNRSPAWVRDARAAIAKAKGIAQ